MKNTEGHILAVHERFVADHEQEMLATQALARQGRPLIAGADPVVPSHPLGPPTVDGSGNITINMLLQQPTRITRIIEDLTLQRFVLDRVFSSAGGVSGGAVIYDEVTANQLYLETGHDVEPIAPGAEYPLVEGTHPIPKIAAVEKWGGRSWITDEARDRNDYVYFQRKVRQLANSIVKKLNVYAMAKLDASISSNSRTGSSISWADATTTVVTSIEPALAPLKTFAAASAQFDVDELGITPNLVILNPQEWENLVTFYGGLTNLRDLIGELGFAFYVTNRQEAGKAKFLAEGQVGGYSVEQPLQTITYRGSAGEDTDRTFVKSGVRPVAYVDNPFAVYEYSGLAA